MNQNVYQISYMCQHKLGRRLVVLRFRRIYPKHFNVKKSNEINVFKICNTYCVIHCKIQMIILINSQKLIKVFAFLDLLEFDF